MLLDWLHKENITEDVTWSARVSGLEYPMQAPWASIIVSTEEKHQ